MSIGKNLSDKVIYKYNFSKTVKEGYIWVAYDEYSGVPLYNKSAGYGFIDRTSSFPEREVHVSQIVSNNLGFEISKSEFYVDPKFRQDNYNNYGMAFRISVPAGACQYL